MPLPHSSHWSLTARRECAGGGSGRRGAPRARVALDPGAASFPPPARTLGPPSLRRAAGRPRGWARRRQGSRMWWRARNAVASFSSRTLGPAGACVFHAALPAVRGRGRVLPPVGSQRRLEQGNYRSAPAFPLHKMRAVKSSRTTERELTESVWAILCRV